MSDSPISLSLTKTPFTKKSTTMNMKKLAELHTGVGALVLEIERVVRFDARKALRPAFDGHEAMEMFNLESGRELGQIMKFLNSDEGIALNREQVLDVVKEKFGF